MMHARDTGNPRVDLPTLAGLVLLLTPLLTMAHEFAGHALVCVATGHVPTRLGAYYIECPSATGLDGRLVAMAGTGMDIVVAVLAFLAWRVTRTPLIKLAWWIVFTVKGMVAAGYWLFSGVAGLGDWAPGAHGGMGSMPHPLLWRLGLVIAGCLGYYKITRLAMRSLDAMLGTQGEAIRQRKRTAMTVYLVGGGVALVVGLFNPIGIVITLTSAVASSFGGTAGLFNVAFHRPGELPPQAFDTGRHRWLLLAGGMVTVAFALVVGPTIRIA